MLRKLLSSYLKSSLLLECNIYPGSGLRLVHRTFYAFQFFHIHFCDADNDFHKVGEAMWVLFETKAMNSHLV